MKVIPPRKISASAVVLSLDANRKAVAGGNDLDFETPRGMKAYRKGDRINVSGQILVCRRVTGSGSTFFYESNKSKTEHLSAFYDSSIKILSSHDGENQTNINQKQNTDMAKKTTTKENGKVGKIEFIDELLQSGKHTKAEVQALAAKEFPGIGKNTTNWACSTMKERTGRISKHLPKVGASEKPAAKKPASKKPAAKKSPPKRKTAVETETAPAAEPVAA